MAHQKNSFGWLRLKFTDVLDVQGGTQPPKSQFISDFQDGYVRLLQIRDFGRKPVPTYIPDTAKLKKCAKSDLLIGRYGASLGRICTGMEGAYNVALAKVVTPPSIDRKFLRGYLNSEHFQGELRLLSRSAQNGFNKGDLETFDFLLPPLAEQKVIADKLDTLLAQVGNTKARLERILKFLKRFRQSVLAAAVSGRLTEEWREVKDVSYSWETKKLGEISSDISYGYTASSTGKPIGPKMLRITDIQGNRVDWKQVPFCEIDESKKEKYLLKKGDLVFARTGATVGKSFLINDQPPESVYASYLIRVRCRLENSIKYFALFFQSNSYWSQIVEFSAGIGQPNVNGSKLKSLVVPLPSLEEQTEIARRVDQLFAYADTIEKQVNSALKRINQLTQSILAKAFRGELTAQWREENPELISGENSAEALLARIKEERAAQAAKKRTRKKATA